ncbi:carbohydrate ABC transporter permease [Pyrococcus furiosus DSM 3638]|uniref:Carbohydrate ABC transporter permease n=3 Tax=Pyrococcus furiosus TaxID=2261 RepID=A0A5C0XUK2_PYRFU|nr:carbohydrate ABC transporter permease [Pyrococcus furiosus]AAL82093.1 sugar ABC transporter, permease protein [Pyrococcus furiosus DSM 3638]AFN04672.1 binding-protein-dependent transport systems inner membrane component [Pyrococcus furiosus COM1]QEK79564.1 carbohydrate ABC transporter permease [Pyrococcus furiosus DSM 3638]
MNEKTLFMLKKVLFYAFIFTVVAWIIIPLIVSALYAFSTKTDYYDPNKVIPTSFTSEWVKIILFTLGAWDGIKNSVIVALLTIAISFLLGVPAGYAIARYVFKGKDTIKLSIIALRMFPIPIMAIPLVVLYIKLHLVDTLLGVALAHTAMALPFVVLITSSIFASVDKELEEAAMVFGLTRFGAFKAITLPLALPGLAAAAMFTFVMSWNEVFVASVLTLKNRTLPAQTLSIVAGAAGGAAPAYYKFAAAFIMVLPAMLFIFFARKYLITMWGITLR